MTNQISTFMEMLFDDSMLEDDDESVQYDADCVDDYDSNDEFTTLVIRGKFMLDGAETLMEAAELARDYASFLEDLVSNGYELTSAVENDHALAKLNS